MYAVQVAVINLRLNIEFLFLLLALDFSLERVLCSCSKLLLIWNLWNFNWSNTAYRSNFIFKILYFHICDNVCLLYFSLFAGISINK